MKIVFHILDENGKLSGTMDSPDQGAKGIPVTTSNFENKVLKLAVSNAKIEYEGVLGNDGVVTGNFKQSGMYFPMNL